MQPKSWSPDYPRQRFVRDAQGRPVPLLVPKGYAVFNNYTRYLLVDGPRKSSKTINNLNRLMRHCWENSGAVAGIITKTLKNAEIGVWADLLNFILPGWLDAGFGLRILDGPKTDPSTKMQYLRLSNSAGGSSEIQLHSLDDESKVEAKFKGARWSFLYLSEADQFKARHSFDILCQQLRVIGIPFDNHQFILDCNPPEEADEHWLDDVFHKRKGLRESAHARYGEITFTLDDNPFLPSEERQDLEDSCAHDPILYDRFIRGLWVRASRAGHFDTLFVPNLHIVGDVSSPAEKDWKVIIPPKNTMTLGGGIDLGELNHSAGIWCPREPDDGDETVFDKIDEVVNLDRPMAIEEFAAKLLSRVEFWEQLLARLYGTKDLRWEWWADSSLFEYRSALNTTEAAVFWDVTRGRINLRPVIKGPGSVKARLSLAKRLFFRHRLFFSAQCAHGIAWARHLKPGSGKHEIIDPVSKFKHTFDADTYYLGSKVPMELQRRRPTTASGITTI